MFDVGFSELVLLAIVALVVLGPEKLPHAARVAGAWVGRIRRSVSTMQAEIEREIAAQEVRSQLEKQFGASGAAGLVQTLQEEHKDMEALWTETQDAVRDAMNDTPAHTIAPPAAADLPAPAGEAVPLLPDVAKPLDQVEVDGEKAYREWLEAQRRPPASPNPDEASKP